MVRYYGYYSNVLRGKRKKEEQDDIISCIIEENGVSPEKRKAWVRLIQKIYEVTPLEFPECQGIMKIIAFIVSYTYSTKKGLLINLSLPNFV